MSLDDRTAAAVRDVAGGDGKMSGWVAGVVRQRLIEDACAEVGRYDASNADEAFELARLAGEA